MLNGEWEFAIDAEARWRTAEQVDWNRTIHVPFAPEARRAVGETGFSLPAGTVAASTLPRSRPAGG